MAAKIWLGFGGCKFEADWNGTSYNYTATFSGADGQVGFAPIQRIRTNKKFNLRSRLFGFRAEIQTNEIYNIADDDNLEYTKLAQILTYLVHTASDSQKTVTITPRYDTDLTTNLNYECILSSSVMASDISRCKTGQVMGLKWSVIAKQDNIPTFISDTEGNNYADDSSNRYVDDSGNYYVDGLG